MSNETGATMAAEPVRWGVLSTANIGLRAVLPAIIAARNSQAVAIASRTQAAAERIAADVPGMRAYGSYEALLDDPAVEAVYIPLPNALHAEWTMRAARAGKHVLCEKPLGATPDEARAMAATCREQGVLLMEAFMYRFHPQIRWALEQLAAGAIGRPVLVRGAFSFDIRARPDDIRLQAALAGGALMDVGCYPLNFSRAVFGRAPQGALARVDVPAGSEVERTTAAMLEFGDSHLAIIDCSFEQPPCQFVQVVGDAGRLTLLRPFTPELTEVEACLARNDETLVKHFAAVDQYRLQVEHFAQCVRSGAAPALTLEDSIEQAEAIEAIYASAGYRRPW
jgi:D-xylose 1-dehydrogenase (NADP+, D-xylono-1,5-lactone-forming)